MKATKNKSKINRFTHGILAIALSMPIFFTACVIQKPSPSQAPPASTPSKETVSPSTQNTPGATETPDTTDTPLPGGNPDEAAEKLLRQLTLEEKVGQLFFIASRTTDTGENRYSADAALNDILSVYKPGGFIFFAENLDSISQTQDFIKDLQNNSRIPLFIGIDEEGGIVTRLNKAEKLHSTVMPAPYDIGQTKVPEYAYKASQVIAREIKSLGFNMNFAPVADVFSNPNNKVIGKRAYGSEAKPVSDMVAEAVKGAAASGIIPVLKHFPGHGDTLQDSHTGAAIVENDLKRLREVEFLPFKDGIQAGAEVVMTAHVLMPKITEDELPATLSKKVIQGLLREELGFDGLIITDGLEMSAISAYYPEEEAVVLAIEAGVDMLLLPKNLETAYDAILSAVKEGRLTEQRIDESVKRILVLKYKHLINSSHEEYDPERVLGSKEHRELAEEIRINGAKP